MQILPARVLAPIVLGAIGGLALALSNLAGSTPVGVAWLVAFYLSLAAAGWIVLRPGPIWWIASVPGSAVGLFLGAWVLFAAHNFIICAFTCYQPPTAFGLLFTINLGISGFAQALTLRGNGRKLVWFAGNVLGGAALGLAVERSTAALHLGTHVVNYVPGLLGGLVWGIVLAFTIAVLPRESRSEVK
jgi:hypothetical protein